MVGDGDTFGGTAEDRFFGVRHDAGIAWILLTMSNSTDFEIDHLQYGVAPVPLPAAMVLFVPALIGLFTSKRG